MTELTIRPEEIRDALQKYVAEYQPAAASREEVGTVAQCAVAINRSVNWLAADRIGARRIPFVRLPNGSVMYHLEQAVAAFNANKRRQP